MRTVFRLIGLFSAAALLLSLLACGAPRKQEPPADEKAHLSFTDSTGEAVTLTGRPRTVAVLFSSFADIWVTAGGSVAVTVGESVERGFADSGAVLVDSGAGHTVIDVETLIGAEPDLVIGTVDYACQSEAVAACRKAGIPAGLFRVESFTDYCNMLEICCRILETPERFDAYGTQVAARIGELLEKVRTQQAAGQAPHILFLRAGSSARSTKAKTGAEHFAAAMLEELGALNIANRENGLTAGLSAEVILSENPDHILITTMGDEVAAKDYINTMLQSPAWQELTAVREGRVAYLPKDLFHFKPNARWAEAYEALILILYPEFAL